MANNNINVNFTEEVINVTLGNDNINIVLGDDNINVNFTEEVINVTLGDTDINVSLNGAQDLTKYDIHINNEDIHFNKGFVVAMSIALG